MSPEQSIQRSEMPPMQWGVPRKRWADLMTCSGLVRPVSSFLPVPLSMKAFMRLSVTTGEPVGRFRRLQDAKPTDMTNKIKSHDLGREVGDEVRPVIVTFWCCMRN